MSQIARDRRRSEQWRTNRPICIQQPVVSRPLLDTEAKSTSPINQKREIVVPEARWMRTRSNTKVCDVEEQRCDTLDEYDTDVANSMSICTPDVPACGLNPYAAPFDNHSDLLAMEAAESVSPVAACPMTLDVSLPQEDNETVMETLSDVSSESDADCELVGCDRYWCSYGGGQINQDRSRDGLLSCSMCQMKNICTKCMANGRHSRHRQFITVNFVCNRKAIWNPDYWTNLY